MGNPTIELMSDHRTVRDYAAHEIPREDLETAVRAAQMSSTSSHLQAYCVLSVANPATRAELADICGQQRQVVESGVFLIICGDVRRHKLIAERTGRPFEQNLESFLVAVIDASLFAQNLSLAFEALGYGICYIGSLRNDLQAVDRLLELPSGVLPLYGLCAGKPRSEPSLKPRLPLEAVLFEERYPDDERMLNLVEEFDETMKAYYEERGAAGRDWVGGVLRHVGRASRPDLPPYYEGKGARLK